MRSHDIVLCVLPLLLGAAACSAELRIPAGPSADESQIAAGWPALDPGRKGPHRLNNTEYNNTVRDLLGTELAPATNFLAEQSLGFDNIADALGMTGAQFEAYFAAAQALAADVFAKPALQERIVTCTPPTPRDTSCAQGDLERLGERAFRRPLFDSEGTQFLSLYTRALELGLTHVQAMEHVTATLLASPQFLYRVELDSEPASSTAQRVDAYAMASRLSYFLWSTMPDDALFALAADGSLLEPVVLEAEVERMLADPRSRALVDNFASEWLGMRALANHKVLAEIYPEFDESLKGSMIAEAKAYFEEFLYQDVTWDRFLSADVNFVDARLAAHYGMPAPDTDGLVRVEAPNDPRRGFLGLASFLTVSSFAHRTSPTLRAKEVLSALLCSTPPPPPADLNVGDLDGDEAANAAAALDNVRERLALHRSDPKCASCHAAMDPIGLGLEGFDGIGRQRETYPNGDRVDARGELPDGRAFDGLSELSTTLQADPRFSACVAEKLFIYALGRGVQAGDQRVLKRTVERWKGGDQSFRSLIKLIVTSEPFRFRRGS